MAKAIRMEMAEAHRLQALDTTVVNPSGLDAPGQFSSAYDLALWGRAGLQRGDLRKYAGTQHWQFPGNTTATKKPADPAMLQLNSENRLLGKYPGIVGVKPGYTTLARNTDIVAAERDGRTILVTLMGVPHPSVTQEAAAFLDWGFAHDGRLRPVGTLVEPISVSLLSAEDAGTVITSTREVTPTAPRAPRMAVGNPHRLAVGGGAITGTALAIAGLRLFWGRRRNRVPSTPG
jgi:D-alanyl-D-alanine carboxypeptidase (penicillin-binding protein 5/6)